MKKMTILGTTLVLALSMQLSHAGDAAAGNKAFGSKGCTGCHGKSGKQPIAANYPVIGGKSAEFIAAELTKFKTGERKDGTMSAMAGLLSDDDIANIAAYLATQ